MKKLIVFAAVVALATPAVYGAVFHGVGTRPTTITEMDNGDGTWTYWVEIDSLPEVSFLDLSIDPAMTAPQPKNINQISGGALYASISSSPWAPSVVFTSDALLAAALDANYAANQDKDTVIDDTYWPGKVAVNLDPNNGDGNYDGTEHVHVALTSFTGGVGGPLPGGPIALAHITTYGRGMHIYGVLQSDSDQVGSFAWWVPEPSTALLAAFGLMGLAAVRRRS